jgi:hypothetical protein
MSEKNDRAASDEVERRLPRSFQLLLDFARSRGIVLPNHNIKEAENHGDH